MTSCQYKQSTERYGLFKNEINPLKDFSQKLILTVLSNLFRTLQTYCIETLINKIIKILFHKYFWVCENLSTLIEESQFTAQSLFSEKLREEKNRQSTITFKVSLNFHDPILYYIELPLTKVLPPDSCSNLICSTARYLRL
jgi:hypothetical protein